MISHMFQNRAALLPRTEGKSEAHLRGSKRGNLSQLPPWSEEGGVTGQQGHFPADTRFCHILAKFSQFLRNIRFVVKMSEV